MWEHLVLIFLENMRREGKGEADVENGRKDSVVGDRRGDYNWVRKKFCWSYKMKMFHKFILIIVNVNLLIT